MTMTNAAATNREIGEILGLTHAGVSRLRSGDRLPSIDTMFNIEAEYGWKIDAQMRARKKGSYSAEFEQALVQHHGALLASASA